MRGLLFVLVLAGCGRVSFGIVAPAEDALVDPDAGADAPADADLAAICAPAYQPVEGLRSRYRLSTGGTSWIQAELDCESDGGHLVVIDDAAEDAWVSAQRFGWIGLSDHLVEGDFVPVTGGPLGFMNWKAGEPSNSLGSEDCVEIRDDLRWNDSGCGSIRGFVCECDGVPLPVPPTWCQTGTDTSCSVCGDVCPVGTTCGAGQTCIVGPS